MKREADPVTIDHIIELRKEIARLEKQLNNALDVAVSLKKELDALRTSDNRRLQVLQDGEGTPQSTGFLQHGIYYYGTSVSLGFHEGQ